MTGRALSSCGAVPLVTSFKRALVRPPILSSLNHAVVQADSNGTRAVLTMPAPPEVRLAQTGFDRFKGAVRCLEEAA